MANADVVYGVHPVTELLESQPKRIKELHIAEGRGHKALKRIITLAREANIKIKNRPHQALGREADNGNHQGVLAFVSPFEYADVEDLIAAVSEHPAPLVVFADGIQDPHNLGAIVRSAHAMGALGLVIPRERAASVTHTVERASAGATSHLPIAQVVNLARTLDAFFEAGLWMTALTQGSGTPLWQINLTGSVGLVIGSEGKGIRPNVLKRCHSQGAVPLEGRLESLNASVAAGIALYEVLRQRGS